MIMTFTYEGTTVSVTRGEILEHAGVCEGLYDMYHALGIAFGKWVSETGADIDPYDPKEWDGAENNFRMSCTWG